MIAAGFADFGFDVRMGQLFQTPTEAARLCQKEKVDCVGISSLAGGHRELIKQFVYELNVLGKSKVHIVVGGVIPDTDIPYLKTLGIESIFRPGTVVCEAVLDVIRTLNRKVRNDLSLKANKEFS
ncbi:cobalamin-dependent protein [Bacillus sp. JCM 19034]|uniref:cobalamin-dependent protein n=1 Tax=Bacillus sp. JCM 19034 TaxID=1481928 RepID=UPI000A93958B|nr:cobalamin-dependent protein [Bacillus sp. JCM 19034]